MDPITMLLILAIVGSIGSLGTGIASAATSYNAQKEANEANVQLTRETNAQNQYNIEHAHQIEMADLKAAGLNPVLTATGGSGAPISMLNSPKVAANAPDLSGIGSALSGMSNYAMMAMMMQYRMDMANERNNTLTAIAKGHDATSSANAVLRKETLDRLYQRKAGVLNNASEGYRAVSSAKNLDRIAKQYGMTAEQLKKIVKYPWVKK